VTRWGTSFAIDGSWHNRSASLALVDEESMNPLTIRIRVVQLVASIFSGWRSCTSSVEGSAKVAQSSAQHELHRNRDPHGHRLPTPSSRLEAPAPDSLDG
jgi:hypothetical protein